MNDLFTTEELIMLRGFILRGGVYEYDKENDPEMKNIISTAILKATALINEYLKKDTAI